METHLEQLCRALAVTTDLSVLVSSEDRHTTAGAVDGVQVTRVGRLAEIAATSVSSELVRHLRETPADIVHLHHPNPMGFLAYLLSGHTGKLVVTYHSDIIRQKVLNIPFQAILRRVLDRASAILVASPNYIDSSPVLRAYRGKCRVIPFGIPLDDYRIPHPALIKEARERYGPRFVLTVGRLVYYKGFSYLIDAMRQVSGAKAVLVGTGPLRTELEREARDRGVLDKIVFAGEVEDLVPLYHAAELFVLPSVARSEAFGIVQMEALACGLPVVNTSIDSGVPFVSLDGVTGLTVNPRDAESLARAIQYVLDRPGEQSRFRLQAYLRARSHFDVRDMTAKTLAVYRQIAGQNLAAVAMAS
jgi:rhamnosyl/mannosyltransferase